MEDLKWIQPHENYCKLITDTLEIHLNREHVSDWDYFNWICRIKFKQMHSSIVFNLGDYALETVMLKAVDRLKSFQANLYNHITEIADLEVEHVAKREDT